MTDPQTDAQFVAEMAERLDTVFGCVELTLAERDRLVLLAAQPTCATCAWNEPHWRGQIRCFNSKLTGIAPVAFKPELLASEFGCHLHAPAAPAPERPEENASPISVVTTCRDCGKAAPASMKPSHEWYCSKECYDSAHLDNYLEHQRPPGC